jgi:hypothetical protein
LPGLFIFSASTKEHRNETLDAENHLLEVEFHIKMHINTSTSKLKDTLKTLDDVRVNILQPTVQDLINNGTFDINNFTLTNASFVTSNNWEITCDSGHILDQSICSKINYPSFIVKIILVIYIFGSILLLIKRRLPGLYIFE